MSEYNILGYRVENVVDKCGLWRTFDGSYNPVFDQLTDGQCRNMPMEDSDFYRQDGKQWFCCAPSKETLKHWFSLQDVEELDKIGFKIYEFELKDVKVVSDFELVFTRDNIISQRELDKSEIWND